MWEYYKDANNKFEKLLFVNIYYLMIFICLPRLFISNF